MKRFILTLIVLALFIPIVFAENWDDIDNLDRIWDGQKSITNKEFEQVMDAIQEKSKKKEEKKRKKRLKKIFGTGEILHSELQPDNEIEDFANIKPKEEGLLINVPVNLLVDEQVLEKGFYKIIGEKNLEKKKLYLNFYQSQYFKGRVEVAETEDDYGEENVDFARVIPYNDQFVKVIFGSIDFNAYVLIPYVE